MISLGFSYGYYMCAVLPCHMAIGAIELYPWSLHNSFGCPGLVEAVLPSSKSWLDSS